MWHLEHFFHVLGKVSYKLEKSEINAGKNVEISSFPCLKNETWITNLSKFQKQKCSSSLNSFVFNGFNLNGLLLNRNIYYPGNFFGFFPLRTEYVGKPKKTCIVKRLRSGLINR